MRTFALAPAVFALVATFAWGLVFASPASATTNFPAAIQNDLQLANPPDCSLCHTTGEAGGKGTVNTPFGTSMRALGLVEFDESSLKNALTQSAAQGIDSDGDCVGDVDELKAGTNPNVADGDAGTCGVKGVGNTEIARYGCGAHVAPSSDAPLAALACVLGLALPIAIRRRRR